MRWLRADVEHIVAANEGVTIFALELPVHVLLGLLHGNVHVAIEGHQNPWRTSNATEHSEIVGGGRREICQQHYTLICHSRVEFNDNGSAQHELQEIRGRFLCLGGCHLDC